MDNAVYNCYGYKISLLPWQKEAVRKTQNKKVVIDEIHYMFDNPDRARAYAEGLLRTSPTSQVLMLSATINTNNFRKYAERLLRRSVVVFKERERPVKLNLIKEGF